LLPPAKAYPISHPELGGKAKELHRLALPRHTPAMAIFEMALAFVLLNEGNTYVFDALDRGGPTLRGVTLATLSAYRGAPQTAADVQALGLEETQAIYKKMYWAPIKGDSIRRQPVATAIFDMAVLCGPARAARMAQTAVGAKADGIIGPLTLGAINAMPSVQFLEAFTKICNDYLNGIAQANPTQNRFLAGWSKRTSKFANLA